MTYHLKLFAKVAPNQQAAPASLLAQKEVAMLEGFMT